MATPTDAELLAATREAILRITQYGSAVSTDGGTLTEADLADLYKAEAKYAAAVAAAASSMTGGLRICKVTPKGMN